VPFTALSSEPPLEQAASAPTHKETNQPKLDTCRIALNIPGSARTDLANFKR
jgi:hypothetical protein